MLALARIYQTQTSMPFSKPRVLCKAQISTTTCASLSNISPALLDNCDCHGSAYPSFSKIGSTRTHSLKKGVQFCAFSLSSLISPDVCVGPIEIALVTKTMQILVNGNQ